MPSINLKDCVGFDWDDSNRNKNQEKHSVTWRECEQAFFNTPFVVFEDLKHSISEKRFYSLGITNANRKLFIAFTIRKKLIRVISARDMHKKERTIYEKFKENS